ncbi:MAG: beta-ketoacyl-ACP synthase II [Caulobacterales bacterium 32-67-6]|nr:MAG: beta-ketoacyl-ACP synthase II [Caulobacterales bacterium 32-67-6]
MSTANTRRVVVTGLGLVTPLGSGVEVTWKAILAGKSGAGNITTFDASTYACNVACEVPRVDGRGGGGPEVEGAFDPDGVMSQKDQRRIDDFILYAIAAADEAVKDSGWAPEDDEGRERTGVIIGSGIGGLATIEKTSVELHEKGPRRVSPFFIPSALINLASGQVSIRHGFKGPNHSVVTACATGAHAVGDAARMIKYGDADVMVAGGAEAAICPVGIAVAGDAYHITAPAEDGDGGFRAMQAAIKDAGISPADIDYINAHGTSTPLGDEIELGAVERMLGNAASKVTMSSTKSATGHLLGAAGAIEAAFTCLAIRDQIAPPTINLDNPSVETPIDLAANKAQPREIKVALSNSFGFGGTNASVVFKQV